MRRGMRPIGAGPCMHSGSRVCIRMHPGMHTSFLPVSAWFQRSGDGPGTCMHCMHHSLIEDSRKGKKPLILMHTMHTREKNSVFSFIYKGFRAFSKPFLYASPDAYRCIHAYKTGRRTSRLAVQMDAVRPHRGVGEAVAGWQEQNRRASGRREDPAQQA